MQSDRGKRRSKLDLGFFFLGETLYDYLRLSKEINTKEKKKGVYFEKRGGGGHRLEVAYGKEVKCKGASE